MLLALHQWDSRINNCKTSGYKMSLRNWVGMFLMGAINNLPYVVVNSAASTIADSFGEKNLVGVVFGANVALSIFVKGLNTVLLLKVSYALRFVVNGCVMLIGLFGIAYAFNFGFAIACIAVVGSSSAFGENVTLGLLLWFPSSLVNAWSSGTGMAGVLGSSLYVLFGCLVGNGEGKTDTLHNLTQKAFLLTTPAVLVYWLAYFVLLKRPVTTNQPVIEVPPPRQTDSQQWHEAGLGSDPQNMDQEEPHNIQDDVNQADTAPILPMESSWRRMWRSLKLVKWFASNLCLVYVFEYVAQACASKVRPSTEYNLGCPELYASLQLCYQAGVFVSRSSVQMFPVRRVEVITVLQFMNMILWIVDDHFKLIPTAALPALMVYVGLLGGASYVNIFYLLLHDKDFPSSDRELCVNITGIFVTVGIVLGSGLQTLLSVTVLKDD